MFGVVQLMNEGCDIYREELRASHASQIKENLVTKSARMEPKGRDLAPKSFGRKPCKLLPFVNATQPISFACAKGGQAPYAKCH